MNAFAASAYDGVHQFAWDSTSLGNLITCPKLYHYKNILGYVPKTESVHLTFGSLAHSAREQYEHHKAKGESHDTALHKMIRWLFENTADFVSSDSYKNRETLIRTMVWYCEHFKNDALTTVILANGKPAIELSFRFELDSSTMLCGHIDKLINMNGQIWVSDLKTSKSALNDRYFKQFSPSIQMPLYTIAGQVVYNTEARGVIIDGAQILVGGTRFQRAPIPYNKQWLEEWVVNIKHYIELANRYADANYWPMNHTACHKFNGCDFRGVCSRAPEVREIFLAADFEIRRWDPLIPRGLDE